MEYLKGQSSSYEEIEPKRIGFTKYQVLRVGAISLVFAVCAVVGVVFISKIISEPAGGAVILHALPSPPDKDLIVTTRAGSVRGSVMNSRGGREFLAFLGIPYAKAPVGSLRFQPPEDSDSWTGILNATAFGPICMQRSRGVVTGDENCLHLNVYTPKKYEDMGNRDKFAVMVYIHGGGASGSSRRNTGEYFMDEDVVLVAMNYRMGVLGNLNLNNSKARGNQGLRDQVKALEWVQANIRNFGGDPRRVTLFGNSFGSMAIATHVISPLTKGLFNQYICQSGQAIFPDLLQPNPVADAFKLSQILGCNSTSTDEVFKCLNDADAGTLAAKSREIKGGYKFAISSNVFTTTVDPVDLEGVTSDAYLPNTPLKLLQSAHTKAIPAMIGVNKGEGLFQSVSILSSPATISDWNDEWERVVPSALNLNGSNPNVADFVRSARDFYFGVGNISSESSRDNLTNLFSDRLGMHPAHVSASFQKEANANGANVYQYYFTKNVETSYLNINANIGTEFNEELGPGHADEVQFLFPYEPFPIISLDSPNAQFSKMMVHLWASFAQSGKPTLAPSTTTTATAEWLPIGEKPYGHFELNDEPKMTTVLADRMAFWDKLDLSDLYV